MSTNYPGALDTTTQLKNDAADNTLTAGVHAPLHNNISDAILAVETELGVNPSGSFATVAAAIAGGVFKAPSADQIITPTGDFVGIAVKASGAQNLANLIDARDASNNILFFVSRLGALNAQSYQKGGAALASTHLSDTALLARLASPAFTGTPTAPTATGGTNTGQLATTAFIAAAVAPLAPLASPAFTGNPVAPTPTAGDNDTSLATTAFVQGELSTALGAYADYTPSLVAGGTLGNATMSARWRQFGKTVHVMMDFFFGSTTSFTGTPTWSLPVNARNTSMNLGQRFGARFLHNGNSDTYWGVVNVLTTSSFSIFFKKDDGTNNEYQISGIVPVTWATNDRLRVDFFYEAV